MEREAQEADVREPLQAGRGGLESFYEYRRMARGAARKSARTHCRLGAALVAALALHCPGLGLAVVVPASCAFAAVREAIVRRGKVAIPAINAERGEAYEAAAAAAVEIVAAQIAQDPTHGKVLQMTSCVGGGDAFSAAAVMCTRAFPCSVCRTLWGGTIILCVCIQLSNNVYTGNILVNSICPYKVWSAARLKRSV